MTVGAIFKKGIRVVQAVSSHTSSASSHLHHGPPLNVPPQGTGHHNPFHMSNAMSGGMSLGPQHSLGLQGQGQHPNLSAHHSLPQSSSSNNNNNPYQSSIGTLQSSRNYALSLSSRILLPLSSLSNHFLILVSYSYILAVTLFRRDLPLQFDI